MHVPEENLTHYRSLRGIMRSYESLGGLHSGIGEYAEANRAWAIASQYRQRMDALRAARRPPVAAETFTHPTTPTAADRAAKPSTRTQKEQM